MTWEHLTAIDKEWIIALLRVRSPLDEPTKEDAVRLAGIQKRLRLK